MSGSDPFIERYVKAWNAHDVEALLAMFTDDAVYADAAIGVAKEGKAAIGDFMRFFFDCYANVEYACRNAFRSGDRLAWEWTLKANYVRTSHTGVPATGQQVVLNGASILAMRDDLCVRNTDYWNYATMAAQIGSGS